MKIKAMNLRNELVVLVKVLIRMGRAETVYVED